MKRLNIGRAGAGHFRVRNAAAGCRRIAALDCKRAFVLSDPHHAASGARVSWMRLQVSCPLLRPMGHAHAVGRYRARLAKLVASKRLVLSRSAAGSTIGLGKALALRTDLPQIVLPTTMQARSDPDSRRDP